MSKEEYKDWLSSFEMIDYCMRFYSYNDFYRNALIIKTRYKTLTKLEIKIYKLWMYSNRYMKLKDIDLIWDFLNGYAEIKDLHEPNNYDIMSLIETRNTI